jgi:hypothetical protein
MTFYLYIDRVTSLDRELVELRDGIKSLRGKLSTGPAEESKVEIKLGLDLIIGEFRILKEHIATVIRTGGHYDLALILEQGFQILFKKNPSLCVEVVSEIVQFVQGLHDKGKIDS